MLLSKILKTNFSGMSLVYTEKSLRELNSKKLTLTDLKKLTHFNQKFRRSLNLIDPESVLSDKITQMNEQKFNSNLIRYIITVNLTQTNVLISFTNIKGKIIYCYSAGNVNLKGKQKKKFSNVIKLLLKHLISRIVSVQASPIALHFKNVKRGFQMLIISMLKNHFFIRLIKTSDLNPHNGCRPKKLKRKKQRKRV